MTTTSNRLEELRALLHEPRTNAIWAQICGVLDTMTDQEVKEIGAPYVLEHTQGWKRRIAPSEWLRHKDNPRLAVINTLDFGWGNRSLPVDTIWQSEVLPGALTSIEGVLIEEISALFRKRGWAKKFSRFHRLEAVRCHNPESFKKALAAPGWKSVTHVALMDIVDAWPLYTLTSSTALNNVIHLTIRDLDYSDCDNWQFVKMRKLVSLDVSENMGNPGPIALGPVCRNLTFIDATTQDPYWAADEGFLARAVDRFAYSPYVGNLRALLFTAREIGVEGMQTIIGSTKLHDDVKDHYRDMLERYKAD